MVTLYSLLKNNKEYYFNVYILHNNCLNQNEIDDICNKFPLNQFNNFKIHLVDVSYLEIMERLPILVRYPAEIFFKLFPPVLFSNMDKILHLDTDVLVIGDIKEFLETNMNNIYFMGDKNQKNGICAGVLLINLSDLRENHNILADMEKEFLLDNKISEETFFNKVYKNHTKFTPHNYIYTTEGDINSKIDNSTRIIHFTVPKPYVLSRFKIKDLNTKGVKEYFTYLSDFIEPKYKWQFKILKFYTFYLGSTINSLERNTHRIWSKYIKKEKVFQYKSSFLTKKIYKYATIKSK
jgi:lipopolysaccharide biosynthesis glycosyltransferase